MVNLNNRSNYIGTYLGIIIIGVVVTGIPRWLPPTKYRVQCILQTIQYSNTNRTHARTRHHSSHTHTHTQWGRISLRFLFTQIYILSSSEISEFPEGTLLNDFFPFHFYAKQRWTEICALRVHIPTHTHIEWHGHGAHQHACHNIHTYFEYISIWWWWQILLYILFSFRVPTAAQVIKPERKKKK